MKIKMPKKFRGSNIPFLESMERENLEEEVVKTLVERIPRLWQIEYTDADETDLPRELLALCERLEHDLGLDFGDDDEEDEEP